MDTIESVLRAARARIDQVDAEVLLAHALGQGRSWLYAHGDAPIPPAAMAAFETLVQRRLGGEPVAYLIGRQGFWRLDLEITPDTLVPRPETELLVELALARIPRGRTVDVLDLGTGSGAIALALALERPDARVVATDASIAALEVARGNAGRLALGNARFAHGHWWDAVHQAAFDLIVSNPPYIAEGDPHLMQGDLPREPRGALSSGSDGLDAIREIVAGAPGYLRPGGWLLLEHGRDQGPAARRLLRDAGFDEVATERDLEARDRVSLGCLAAAGRASSVHP